MIAIGCDHGGFELAAKIMKHLDEKGTKYKYFGTFDGGSVDYPDIALPVAESVASGECERGILVCGTGVGMSIAANKVNGIRASVCSDHFSVKYTRLHNDSNILCLGGRVLGDLFALELVDLYLETEYEGGRHQARLDKIKMIEEKY
ncbi:MAG: ribose 5-phosphate isomerase B [Clostridia bacterium]|nr:ribose 5-phosphate isomerase B [Clostridia bacterium]MEE1024383.1 ribose 5-phosphate isomerase B [Acutalibacteraceae bacterium]